MPLIVIYYLLLLSSMSDSATNIVIALPAPQIRRASSPFDESDADTILRSSDFFDFSVHRLILSKASPLFTDMLSLPQSSTDGENSDGKPIIQMSEDARVLDHVLRFCYPTPDPSLPYIEDVKNALRAADKLQLDVARVGASRRLLTMAEAEPERAYVIAWLFELADVAIAAARHTLRKPPLTNSNIPELYECPVDAFDALLKYQQECVKEAIRPIIESGTRIIFISLPLDDMRKTDPCPKHSSCNGSDSAVAAPPSKQRNKSDPWISRYFLKAKEALQKRPVPETARDMDLLLDVLYKEAKCRHCWNSARVYVEDASQVLAEAVRVNVNKVNMLPHCLLDMRVSGLLL